MDLAIFGGRGAGEIVAEITDRCAKGAAIRLAGFLNDRLPVGEPLLGGRVLGAFDAWKSLPGEVQFVAPLHKPKEMEGRLDLLGKLGVPDERWARVIDPTAIVAGNAIVSGGSVIGAFTVVGPSNRLGRHVALWPGAQVGHDAEIGDFVFLGRNSIVSGYCRISTGVFIGSGAVVREHCRIGRFAVIGAGATVVSNVPDHAIVVGTPGRVVGTVKTDESL